MKIRSLTININTENDAFGETEEDMLFEVARLLRVLASDLVDGDKIKNLYDKNGNRVGTVRLSGKS